MLKSSVARCSSPPPSPEEALAAQLAQLGELELEVLTLSDKSSAANASAGGGNSKGTGKGKGNNKEDGGNGGGGGDTRAASEGGSDGMMYCSSCGRSYTAATVKESFSRAKSSW